MKLMTEQGELSLPSDFSFEIEQNSAFFSEDGTASLSAVIPATPSDQAKLGFPNRIARSKRFVNAFPAIIQKGIFQKQGVLVVVNADKDTITCSMALEDSEFYTKHKDKNLKELFAAKILSDRSTPSAWAEWFIQVYKGTAISLDFRLVPVAVNYNAEKGTYQVNNEPDASGTGIYPLKYIARTVTEGDSQVRVPDGYGIAPFLTLSAFFREMFSLLGYSLGKNCFADNPHLSSLILLHNCSDVLCNGRVNYSDLVPNKTVSEIIEWLQQKFHAQLSVHPESRSIDILLLEDILASRSDHDLTNEIIGHPSFSYNSAARVVIAPDVSLDGAEAAAETLPDLLDKYGGFVKLTEDEFNTTTRQGCLAQRLATGDFYELSETGKKRVGSNYFKYDRRNADGAEEFSPEDLMPPMVFVNGILMPYIGERKHRNTTYKTSTIDTDQDIIIADYAGLSTTRRYNYATTQEYNDAGVRRSGKQGLGAESQYFIFWKRYGKILLNNRIEISGEFNLSIEDIFRYDMYAMKQLCGQSLLPTYLKYEVGEKIRCIEAKFLVFKDFSDGIADEPIEAPAPAATYVWIFNNSELEAIDEELRNVSYGLDRWYQWANEDQYQTTRPQIDLPEARYAGQKSQIFERYIDIWEEDLRAGGESAHKIGHQSFSQWYEVVAR